MSGVAPAAAAAMRGGVIGTQGRNLRSGRSSLQTSKSPPRSRGPDTVYTSSGPISSSRASRSTSAGGMSSPTSRRATIGERRRCCSTARTASTRSSPSSLSSWKSALRVNRNTCCATTSMPSKRCCRWAAITCSMGTKRSPSGSTTKRLRSGGTLTRAIRSARLARSTTTTMRLSERLEMYGKGCAGSTARGVRTGKIRSSNTRSRKARSASPRLDQSEKRMACASSSGTSPPRNTRDWRA